MRKRQIKGLKSTGRVSIAVARTAAQAIKTAIAKKKVASRTRVPAAPVTSAKTATGKHLVAFRIVSHDLEGKNGGAVALKSTRRTKTLNGSARTAVR